MSTQLRGLLADLASQAPNYADPHRALAEARERRNRRRTVAPLVAFIAVALLVAVPVLYRLDRSAAPVGTDATPGPVEGYPARVVPPRQAVPLPQAPLGSAAAFVYAPCFRDCDPYLVLSDGRQYGLERPHIGPPVYGYTLSPDGVWLGSPVANGFQLRNLVTGRTHELPDAGPGVTEASAWSPDGTKLLLARHDDPVVDHYVLVDVTDAGPAKARQFSPEQIPGWVRGLRNDGDVVTWASGGANGSLPTLAIVDSDTATERARFTLKMPPDAQLLRPGETLEFGPFFLGLSDDAGRFVINGPLHDRPTGYLGVDLANDGHVWGRTDLPPSAAHGHDGDGVWSVAGLVGGVLLIHSAPDQTEIVLMNDINGERTVATTLPADSMLVVRSAPWYSG